VILKRLLLQFVDNFLNNFLQQGFYRADNSQADISLTFVKFSDISKFSRQVQKKATEDWAQTSVSWWRCGRSKWRVVQL